MTENDGTIQECYSTWKSETTGEMVRYVRTFVKSLFESSPLPHQLPVLSDK